MEMAPSSIGANLFRIPPRLPADHVVTLSVCLFPAASGVWATARRNRDDRSELSIWADSVARMPDNARAQNNLALLLAGQPGRPVEAIAQYEAALSLNPNDAEAREALQRLR
jgi:hypothetical protein